ncbi:UNVERIFIED_CONTAM: hypothetical protein QE602_08560 [Streptococcus suis]
MFSYRWELPLASEEVNSTGYIHGNAKPHLFNQVTGFSHCNRYWQVPNYAGEVEYTGIEKHFCKRCLKKYQKIQEQLDE